MSGKRKIWAILTGYACLGVATTATARSHDHAVDAADSKALDPVIACHAVVSSDERLACYDRTVGSLEAAAAKHDIVVVDQAEVAKVRHSLFGFNVPSLNLFGAGKSGPAIVQEDREITAVIGASHLDGDGNWVMTMQDGAIWHQTGGVIAVAPRPGDSVRIIRAALGSYFIRVGKQPGVKARREG